LEKRAKKLKIDLEKCRRRSISSEQVACEQILRYKLEKVQEQIYTYWRQRAHVRWLEKGDRNTSFFHAVCSERKRSNRIGRSRKDDGSWVEEEVEKRSFITNYFMSLFRTNGLYDSHELTDVVQRKITEEMNNSLIKEFTPEEVKAVVDSIGDLKAPGPDEMPAVFYKQFWDVIGEKVTKEVLDVLNGGLIPEGWNETTIVLIPKVKNPDKLKDLRPISLCNVIYKIVSKALANRLKQILLEMISPAQSAFVPGRLISNNILIAYELTHYMKQKKKGKEGYAAVKLDMSKAYDRVEWHFLAQMMEKLEFHQRWINVVMKCVSSVSYKIRVNGELTETFKPERGQRQGDPLSPYLFLLCAEGFSALLQRAEEIRLMRGVKVCPRAPSVSHLLFADDSLILFRANRGDAQQLQSILRLYEECSGQLINKDKSAAMIRKQEVMQELRITKETMNERYLGLPVHVGRSRSFVFAYLKDRIWKRIQGWKEKLLSRAGKEVLIKAVAQAIPTFCHGVL